MIEAPAFQNLHEMSHYFRHGTRDEIVKTTFDGVEHPFYMRRNSSDIKNFEQIFLANEYRECLSRFKTPPDVILDLGAYIGLSALYFKNTYPDATIICVEPSKDNFKLLELNMEPYKDIHCINAAVWVNNSSLGYTEEGYDGDWGNRVGEMEGGRIRAIKINSIVRQYNIRRIGLLKMDIEASEKRVLSEQTEWLELVDVAAVELHERYLYGCVFAFENLFSLSDFDLKKKGETNMAFRRKSFD